jgi:hypothetical protein
MTEIIDYLIPITFTIFFWIWVCKLKSKKSILIPSIVILNITLSFSQEKLNISNTCTYYGEKTASSVYTFESDIEAVSALKLVTDASGLASNFKILASEVPNAAAAIINNQRYILYNQTFMYNITQRVNYWGSISILAHEVGHHLNGHSLLNVGSRPSLELEADKFSGFILAKLGATLEEAQSAINSFVTESGSINHPGKSARLAAIANGWYQNNNSTKAQTAPKNTNRITTRPRELFYGDVEVREQVFIKKINDKNFELISEKGYQFSKIEYKVIRGTASQTEDLLIFWFPDWNSYGYLDNFSIIPNNELFQCKGGSSPVYYEGNKLQPGNYLILIDPEGKYYIIADGKFVLDAEFLGANSELGCYVNRIKRGSIYINISTFFIDIEEAKIKKKHIVKRGFVIY